MDLEPIFFAFHGLLGGILWLLINWKWIKKAVIQHTIVSALAGYVFFLLHSSYNLPNLIGAMIFGYFSVDIIKELFERMGGVKERRRK